MKDNVPPVGRVVGILIYPGTVLAKHSHGKIQGVTIIKIRP